MGKRRTDESRIMGPISFKNQRAPDTATCSRQSFVNQRCASVDGDAIDWCIFQSKKKKKKENSSGINHIERGKMNDRVKSKNTLPIEQSLPCPGLEKRSQKPTAQGSQEGRKDGSNNNHHSNLCNRNSIQGKKKKKARKKKEKDN